MIGHATFCVVVVYNNVLARLRRTSPARSSRRRWTSAPTAGRRSASSSARCSRRRSSPAALLAFALSFDEVIVTMFTAGAQNTLPIWILGNIRRGQQLPERERRSSFVVIAADDHPGLIAQRLTQDTGVLRRRYAVG